MKKGALLVGYARVSKADDQNTAAQVKALRQVGCKRIFEEKASGGRWDRPQLHKALEQLREGDVLVVWKLDRLSRSLKDLLHIMERVRDAGAGFRSRDHGTVLHACKTVSVRMKREDLVRQTIESFDTQLSR